MQELADAVSGDETSGGAAPAGGVCGGVAELSFEQARAELDTVVAALERGNVPLEEALALFERGEALIGHCRDRLEAVRVQVSQRLAARDGNEGASAAF